MDGPSQFEAQQTPAMDCAAFERLLAEAVEAALQEGEAAAVADHATSCAVCGALLEQARQGHDWLLLLKQAPLEPPDGLVDAILARTSGGATKTAVLPGPAVAQGAGPVAVFVPPVRVAAPMPWRRPVLFTLRRALLDPRLVLTAAMAFFSISLTLDLLGVRLAILRPADLAPQELRRTLTRQFFLANAHVVRYYENLRFVYEVESRVQELRRAAEITGPAEQPGPQQKQGQPKQKYNKSSTGLSLDPSGEIVRPHKGPLARTPRTREQHPPVQGPPVLVPAGPLEDAAFHMAGKTRPRVFRQAAVHPRTQKILNETQDHPPVLVPCGPHGPVPERSAV